MRRILFSLLLLLLFIFVIFNFLTRKDNKKIDTIKVSEVAHSIFYAPWYVAIENKYFEEENIKIDLTLTPGADKVASSVLSNDVNIGFAGLEASIYVYNNGEKDYLENFAALTKRDGQFIVGDCDEKGKFNFNMMKNKKVLAGRIGGMPLMNYVYALKNEGINSDEVRIDTSVDFASLSGAYISGSGDYVNLFEPNALSLENEGYGCVLDNIGAHAGEVPYTVFMARKSYIENNSDIIKRFNKALNKGIKFVLNNDEYKIAKTIYNEFPDNNINELASIIKRYKDNDSWWNNTYITKESYDRLLDIMKYSNALEKNVDYKILVNNKYNEEFINN